MRERLLDAARAIAVEQGWSAVTIRRIADRLEYSSPILYQHFTGKEALLDALLRDGFRRAGERLAAALARHPADPLTALARAYWDFAFAAPELYQVMHGLDGVPFGTAETPAEARAVFDLWRSALVHFAEQCGTTLRDPDAAVDTVWAFLHGSVSLAMAGRTAGSPRRARRLALAGVRPLFDSQLGADERAAGHNSRHGR
jgi:AcrR family transcriptional regulator